MTILKHIKGHFIRISDNNSLKHNTYNTVFHIPFIIYRKSTNSIIQSENVQTPSCKHIWSYIHMDVLLSCPILFIDVMRRQNGSWLLEGSKWHSRSTQINRKINCPISNNTYNVGTKTYLAAQVLQTGNIYMYNILHLTCNVSRRTLHIFQHLPKLTHI